MIVCYLSQQLCNILTFWFHCTVTITYVQLTYNVSAGYEISYWPVLQGF